MEKNVLDFLIKMKEFAQDSLKMFLVRKTEQEENSATILFLLRFAD